MMNQTLLQGLSGSLQHVQPFSPSISPTLLTIHHHPQFSEENALFLWPAPYVTMILARLEIWQVLASSTYGDCGTTSQPAFPDPCTKTFTILVCNIVFLANMTQTKRIINISCKKLYHIFGKTNWEIRCSTWTCQAVLRSFCLPKTPNSNLVFQVYSNS